MSDELVSQDILQYVNEAAAEGTAEFQVQYLAEAAYMGAQLQLDRPLVRIQNQDGAQVATLHVPTSELIVIQPREDN